MTKSEKLFLEGIDILMRMQLTCSKEENRAEHSKKLMHDMYAWKANVLTLMAEQEAG